MKWKLLGFLLSFCCSAVLSILPMYSRFMNSLVIGSDPAISSLKSTFQSKFLEIDTSPLNTSTNIELYICGTFHISKKSVDMTRELIQAIKPQYVFLEVCSERFDALMISSNRTNSISLKEVWSDVVESRSIRSLGIKLLAWMQHKTASLSGNKLGREIEVAAQEASKCGSYIILGDRPFSQTMRRVDENINWSERIQLVFAPIFEICTLTIKNLQDYIRKSEEDFDFITKEMESFARYMPNLARVIIFERDEYMAINIVQLVRSVDIFHKRNSRNASQPIRIVAVVGAGHLKGIQHRLLTPWNLTKDRLLDIS